MTVQPGVEQVLERIVTLGRYANSLSYNREPMKELTTNEDFSRMLPDSKRLLIVGCAGAGKSTLCNKLAGHRYEWDEGSQKFIWDCGEENLLFRCKAGAKSVTQHTTYANLAYMGAEERPFVCVDTPGHDDTGTDDHLLRQAADLHQKLQRMGYVNGILVLHNDVVSGRFSPATRELMTKIQHMFRSSKRNVWDHVIVAFSHCDESDRGWRSNITTATHELQMELRRQFPACQVDVPVVALCGTDEPGAAPWQSANFERLWAFLDRAPCLCTVDLEEFEGMSLQLKRVVKERDDLQRLVAARKNYQEIAQYVLVLMLALSLRPSFMNADGAWDELLVFAAFVYIQGITRVFDFFRVAWDDYILRWINSGPVGLALQTRGVDPMMFRLIRHTAGAPPRKRARSGDGSLSASASSAVARAPLPTSGGGDPVGNSLLPPTIKISGDNVKRRRVGEACGGA